MILCIVSDIFCDVFVVNEMLFMLWLKLVMEVILFFWIVLLLMVVIVIGVFWMFVLCFCVVMMILLRLLLVVVFCVEGVVVCLICVWVVLVDINVKDDLNVVNYDWFCMFINYFFLFEYCI